MTVMTTDISRIADGLSEPWKPRSHQWPWHDFLTADEAAIVADAERKSASAKQALAEATAILNPIRNRAIQRAKYDAQRSAKVRRYLEGKSS